MSYLYDTIEDIVRLADRESISFSEVVLRAEIESTASTKEDVLDEIRRRIQIFKESVRDGIADTRTSKSGMSGGQAKQLDERKPVFLSDLTYRALRYAISVNEANAKMFRIVACPTAGACGILPGVMKRNGIYAVHALAAAEMALAGLRSRIPADEVIGAMDSIGRALPEALRETSEGGLAKTKTGMEITKRLAHQK